ncbi:MAG: microcystin degradation protein MlrC [Planctomycetota bacterium]|jgi:microcystin degradation protein MlrC
MKKILVAECKQEISTFNPVVTHYEDFVIHRGKALFDSRRDTEAEIAGALDVFGERDDIELIPAWGANACSSGSLEQAGFARLAAEFVEAITPYKGQVDAFYFVLHGAMGATEELDPEGYLLQEARRVLGTEIPLMISLDLHGILTERMLDHCDALAIYHTYPHVDLADTGKRASRLLLRMLDEDIQPVIARVVVPTLVRGDELKTATGVYGESIRRAQELERTGGALAAGMMIGNPFTDVPELCSQALVVTDGDAAAAEKAALEIAEDFWPKRAQMQAPLVDVKTAIAQARTVTGTSIFADAADATSSGASGDSNAILTALIEEGYEGTVLLPIVDVPAVERAFSLGVGQSGRFMLGGTLDTRFTPIEVEAKVAMLATGPYHFESWDTEEDGGDTAVLLAGNITIIATSRPVYLFDRSLFLAHGRDPKNYDLVVVKSPHCQDQFYIEWAGANFNIDAPGSTSANLKTLGHTICQRPMYPLEEITEFNAVAQIFPKP